jgi:hypothetical protein
MSRIRAAPQYTVAKAGTSRSQSGDAGGIQPTSGGMISADNP